MGAFDVEAPNWGRIPPVAVTGAADGRGRTAACAADRRRTPARRAARLRRATAARRRRARLRHPAARARGAARHASRSYDGGTRLRRGRPRARDRPRAAVVLAAVAGRAVQSSPERRPFRAPLPLAALRPPRRWLVRQPRARPRDAGLRPRREMGPPRQARPAGALVQPRRARRERRGELQERAVRLEPGGLGRVRAHGRARRPRRRLRAVVAARLRPQGGRRRRSTCSCSTGRAVRRSSASTRR